VLRVEAEAEAAAARRGVEAAEAAMEEARSEHGAASEACARL